jgi:RND family efflux transporter MFP subunit
MKRTRASSVLVLSLLASAAGCRRASTVEASDGARSATPVLVTRAARRDLNRTIVLTGELTPFQEVEVMAKVAGYIRRLYVDIGDRVRKGQVLAVIEIPEMADDLAQEQAAVERNRAELKRAEEDLGRAEAAHQLAHVTYSRLASIFKEQPGLVAQQEVDDAQARDRVAEAQVAAARSTLASAEEQVKMAEARLSKLHTLMQYTRVVAPFDGVVSRRYANDGAMIQAGVASSTQAMPVIRLSQNSLLRVVFPVPESAAGLVHAGDTVEVRVPSLGRSFPGKVARTADRIDTSTRTMRTEVDVPNPAGVLIPGMYAEISLALAKSPGALSVPITSVVDDSRSGKKHVWVVDSSSRLVPRQVKTGMETPEFIEVTEGLKEGETVVVAARGRFHPGELVSCRFAAGDSGR